MKNLYDILELNKTCTKQDIRKSYMKLVLIYHPDKNINGGENIKEKFQEIQNAYEILYDDYRRNEYDNNRYENYDNIDDIRNNLSDIIINVSNTINILASKFDLNNEEVKIMTDYIYTDDFINNIWNDNKDRLYDDLYKIIKKICIKRLSRSNELLSILFNNLDNY